MAIITCKDLTLAYEGLVAVSHLTFCVEKGDYLCIIGDNGTGKSTLMRALLGLKRPSGGEIRFGDGLTRNAIGYLAQQTEVQKDFPASVWEVVLSGCLNQKGLYPFYNKKEKENAMRALKTLGIPDLKQKCLYLLFHIFQKLLFFQNIPYSCNLYNLLYHKYVYL